MAKPSLLIIGCGDLGVRVHRILSPLGWRVSGIRRRPEAIDTLPLHAADYTRSEDLALLEELKPDYVLTTFTPISRDIDGYQLGFTRAAENVIAGLGSHRPKRIIMASSTRVYAEQNGAWVDEKSELSDTDPRAIAIATAEDHFLTAGLPASIVRFGGLYGGPGPRLIERVLTGNANASSPIHYTNRVHRDDAAGFLAHLFTLAHTGAPLLSIYNGVDNEPASLQDIEAWLASQLQVELRRVPAADDAQSVAVGKRCRNQRLRDSEYTLLYPDFRSGYVKLLPKPEPTPGTPPATD
ncbi:hypothetical protein BST95_14290 [Halioglobus japonicus]|nr:MULTISPECIES: NAD(P)H-binding protein [Halioglobus]AQA19238.1 hypothetical protein BST95_14290 [Halioglobus japonicus]KZX59056.1 hypothetical protein A3709_16005 [Halioglobus sp. HI00S01]GHD06920.1 NAD(P)-dependent oxidoreductase [Halioglobus japonicus]